MLIGPGRPVRTIGCERIPDIGYSKDAGREWDLLCLQSLWVARTIPFLMVRKWDLKRLVQVFDGIEHFIGKLRMLAHDDPFLLGQLSGLVQDGIGDADLAHIVQQGTAPHLTDGFLFHPHGLCKLQGQLGYAAAVALGLPVAQIHGMRPAFDGRLVGFQQSGVGFLQFLALLEQLLIAVQAGDADQARPQLEPVEGFRDEIIRTGFQSGQQRIAVIQGGEDDDRDFGHLRIVADALADFETGHSRHHHVQQDHIRQDRLCLGDGLGTVLCHDQVVAFPLEHRLQGFTP